MAADAPAQSLELQRMSVRDRLDRSHTFADALEVPDYQSTVPAAGCSGSDLVIRIPIRWDARSVNKN